MFDWRVIAPRCAACSSPRTTRTAASARIAAIGKRGTANATTMPMMVTTTSSSGSVKPPCRGRSACRQQDPRADRWLDMRRR
ncbi:MAG TPA: hypothetical protein VFM71_02515 [Gemmatimonadaceae bacterium]|nr:hypothetical protein [Gemmatimonadaceae bacterium]